MKKITNILKENKTLILKIVCIILFLIYIVKPISFDVKLYLGAAYQANLIGSFPINIMEAWEHKLILNRLIFYLLFQITNLFVRANYIIIFETLVKLIYGIISILIIKIFSKQTKKFFEKYNISEKTIFLLLYLVLIGSRYIF